MDKIIKIIAILICLQMLISCQADVAVDNYRTSCLTGLSYSSSFQKLERQSSQWQFLGLEKKERFAEEFMLLNSEEKKIFIRNRAKEQGVSLAKSYSDSDSLLGGLLGGDGGPLSIVEKVMGGLTDTVDNVLGGNKEDDSTEDYDSDELSSEGDPEKAENDDTVSLVEDDHEIVDDRLGDAENLPNSSDLEVSSEPLDSSEQGLDTEYISANGC